jgi:hypothetical protein
MTANAGDQSGRVPFEYTAPDCDWSRYTAAMLDPVAVYSGADAQFGTATDDDKRAVAAYMQSTFEAALRRQYAPATTPRADTLRVHVSLTGFETNTPVVSTLSKILPVGLVVNSVKSASGQQAGDSGSVSYAVEIHDASSGQLLRAYVTKQYPMAEDVLASVGPLDATRAGVRDGAEALLTQLR